MTETNTPRVDTVIAQAMAKYPDDSPKSLAAYFQDVHQLLAPLARELEQENTELLAKFNEQEDLLHTLSGVLWRLEEYRYIGRYVDDDEEAQCDHWREIGRQAVKSARARKSKITKD